MKKQYKHLTRNHARKKDACGTILAGSSKQANDLVTRLEKLKVFRDFKVISCEKEHKVTFVGAGDYISWVFTELRYDVESGYIVGLCEALPKGAK